MKRVLIAAAATVVMTGAAAAFDGGRDIYPVDPLTTSTNVSAVPHVDRMQTSSIIPTAAMENTGAAATVDRAAALEEAAQKNELNGRR